EDVAEPRELRLRLVLGGRLLAARGAAARLLERGARLPRDARLVRRGGEILDRLARLAEIEERETAAEEAIGVDLGHLVHEQELREALDGLLEERLLLRRLAGELRALVAD